MPRKSPRYKRPLQPIAHPFTAGPRCLIYSRASTDSQDAALPVPELRAHVARLGGTVVAEIIETGSGARSDRPGYQRALAAARKGECDAVLVHRLDRWGRSALDALTGIRMLTDCGVRFICTAQAIDLKPHGDAMSSLLIGMLASVAEFERELIRSRTRLGLDKARRAGKRLGRPRHAHPTVDSVVKLRAANLSWREIARRLGAGVHVVRLRWQEHTGQEHRR